MKKVARHAHPESANGFSDDLSASEREREYSPSSCIGGNYQPFIEAYSTQSRAAVGACEAMGASWQDLRYGPQPSQRIDLCLPRPSSAATSKRGLLVFIHGGYWQELSAQDSLFAASGCVARGLAFAAVDYTLAPKSTVAQIVDECRAALVCLVRQAEALGIAPENIVVAGSSAGAHLAAMVAWPGWAPAGGGPAIPVRAAVLVSGIYDLAPLVGTSINDALGLVAESAGQVSPAMFPLAGFPPTVVVWGAVETREFKRQSRGFANLLTLAATPCDAFEIPARNHFDVILDLADPSTAMGARTLSLFAAK